MWIFSKTLDELCDEDLQGLVTHGVGEGVSLEFKREAYGSREAEVKEMLRDVCSMANAVGGTLVIGIEEDGEGRALRVVPTSNAEAEANRIIASSVANISERIPGLRSRAIPIQGGHVIVIHIPRSYRKPHMITFQGATDFWVRHDRQKSRMSIAEIRAAITATEDFEMKAEKLIEQRRQILPQPPWRAVFALTGTPLLLEPGRVDISERRLANLLKAPPTFRPQGGVALAYEDRVEPTVRGLKTASGSSQRLEVFRNGHVEFTVSERERIAEYKKELSAWVIRHWAIAEYVRNFVHFLVAFRTLTEITDPYLVGLAMWKCEGSLMKEGIRDPFGIGTANRWEEGDCMVLEPVVAALDEQADGIVRRLVDGFWNAFHFMRCPFFDNEGKFYIPRG